jgi:hypothetical protein
MRQRLLSQHLAALAVVAAALGAAGGCGEVASTQGGQADNGSDGALQGKLAVYIADDLDGRSETRYALRMPDGTERPLLFDHPVDVEPGTELKVWGAPGAEALPVTSFRTVTPPVERVTSALTSGMAYPVKNFAFVLIDLGGGVNITNDAALSRMMTAPESIRNYYLDDSYGRQDINAQVFGPITYSMTNCNTSQLATDLRPMIMQMAGGMDFNHYLWYFGAMVRACNWGGLGEVGSPDRPANDTWYNGSTNCVVLVQEPGHNFGMQHSSSLSCGTTQSFADDPNLVVGAAADGGAPKTACTASEYGDVFDPMGGGCRHMNAWQKSYQGWFGGCNGVTVTSTGTFTLLPFENKCDGAQFLKVPAAKARTFNRPAAGGGQATTENVSFYYVELRTPVDFDGTLGNRTALTPQVLIHVGDDVRSRTQRGVHTFLLDMNPSTTTFNDAALAVGKTFTDPAGGVSITATAVSATSATIDVSITGGTGTGAAPTCLDGTTFPTPNPGPESCVASATTGAGGATGTGGAGGGAGGRGGTAGSDAGAASGTGGIVGTGAGGSTVVSTGTGGVTGTKPADAGIVNPGTGGNKGPGEVTGGCSCDVAPSPSAFASLASLLALASLTRRRRR